MCQFSVYVCNVCDNIFVRRMFCEPADKAMKEHKAGPCKLQTSFGQERECEKHHPDHQAPEDEDEGMVWSHESTFEMDKTSTSASQPRILGDKGFNEALEKRYGAKFGDPKQEGGLPVMQAADMIMAEIRMDVVAIVHAQKLVKKRKGAA